MSRQFQAITHAPLKVLGSRVPPRRSKTRDGSKIIVVRPVNDRVTGFSHDMDI